MKTDTGKTESSATACPLHQPLGSSGQSDLTSLTLNARQFLPRGVRRQLRHVQIFGQCAANFFYDLRRFFRHASLYTGGESVERLRAVITMNYHRIEKGLSLSEPRPGFGAGVVQNLIGSLLQASQCAELAETRAIALNVLDRYAAYSRQHGLDNPALHQQLLTLRAQLPAPSPDVGGGLREISRHQIHQAAMLDLRDFFDKRFSVRQFALGEVGLPTIENAVRMAQKSPSVCNRQAWRVHVFSRDEDKRRVLALQNGNRGFGEQLDKVLLVTADLTQFVSVGERNQGWIDGGMFAMSLVYALHSLGLGTCCLNCSNEKSTDQALRHAAHLGAAEAVIMMIGVGFLPEKLQVAQSPRRPLTNVLVAH